MGFLAVGAPSRALDFPIVANKLIVVDKLTAAGRAKAVFVSRDIAVAKGTGTDPAQIDAVLDVGYDGTNGSFLMPQGADWLVNTSAVAKYVHVGAPAGGAVKTSIVKPGKTFKVVAKSLGDSPLDVSAAPTASVFVAHTLTNGGVTLRQCTRFTDCVYTTIAGGTGSKLVCRIGIVPNTGSVRDGACLATCATRENRFVDLGATVLDTCTSLEWEKKETPVSSGADAGNLHDVDNLYSWAGRCTLDSSVFCQPSTAAAATCATQTGGALGCAECGVGGRHVQRRFLRAGGHHDDLGMAHPAKRGELRRSQ